MLLLLDGLQFGGVFDVITRSPVGLVFIFVIAIAGQVTNANDISESRSFRERFGVVMWLGACATLDGVVLEVEGLAAHDLHPVSYYY